MCPAFGSLQFTHSYSLSGLGIVGKYNLSQTPCSSPPSAIEEIGQDHSAYLPPHWNGSTNLGAAERITSWKLPPSIICLPKRANTTLHIMYSSRINWLFSVITGREPLLIRSACIISVWNWPQASGSRSRKNLEMVARPISWASEW
jgi:hypothetical protein